jgi:hypothetical protein
MFEDPIPDLPHVPRDLMALVLHGMSNAENERPSAVELRDALMAMELGALAPGSLAPEALPGGASFGPSPAGPSSAGAPAGPSPQPHQQYPSPQPVVGPAPAAGAGRPSMHPVGADDETRVVSAAGQVGVRERVAAGGGRPASPNGRGGQAERTPRQRAYLWAGFAAIYVAVLCAAVAVALYLRPAEARTTFVPPPVASSPACPLAPAGTAQCVRTAECFDRVTVTGGVARASTVACTEPHLWEAFATAQLPTGLDTASHTAIKQNAQVRQVCSTANARLLNTEQAWQVEVLPPSRDQVKAGDRTYRCLAGRPPTKLSQSRFVP